MLHDAESRLMKHKREWEPWYCSEDQNLAHSWAMWDKSRYALFNILSRLSQEYGRSVWNIKERLEHLGLLFSIKESDMIVPEMLKIGENYKSNVGYVSVFLGVAPLLVHNEHQFVFQHENGDVHSWNRHQVVDRQLTVIPKVATSYLVIDRFGRVEASSSKEPKPAPGSMQSVIKVEITPKSGGGFTHLAASECRS